MASIIIPATQILTGIILLFGGGELFLQGAVAFALILGIPQLVIGLTIVSLGTSAPEFFVSVSSFFRGSDALAISNVVGSNIFNVMVVLGGSALIRPLKVDSRLVRRDIPLLLGVSAAVWGMASTGVVTWQAGASLLIALILNSIWEIKTAREEPQTTQEAEPEINLDKDSSSFINASIKVIGGIFLLTFGSKVLISGAIEVASIMGISKAIIGLTIVSFGTSMPEFITSLVAAIRGRTDLAIGNVVGSCLLNQLLVLGGCAFLSGGLGLSVEKSLVHKDLPVMVLTTIACMPIFWTKGKISRGEGGALLGLYIFYLADKVIPLTIPEIHSIFQNVVFIIIIIAITFLCMKTIIYWLKIKRFNLSKFTNNLLN